MLTKEIVERKGETCRALPRNFARHTGGGFSPLRLVAGKAPWQTARYACRLARSACRSSFPKISLRCDFREPCLFSGHTFIKMPRLHLSCVSRRYAANGVRLPKGVAFGRAERFLVHMFLGGLCIFPCLPPWGKVSCGTQDGRGAFAHFAASLRKDDKNGLFFLPQNKTRKNLQNSPGEESIRPSLRASGGRGG